MIVNPHDCCLLIIDIQKKLVENIFNKDELVKITEHLIVASEKLELPVIFSEQYPEGLGLTVDSLNTRLSEINSEKITKTSFSCFGSNDFEDKFNKLNRKQVILCGIETHICVLQTAFDLVDRSYEVFLVEDATGSRKESHKLLGLNRMRSFGVVISNFEMLIFELLRDSKNPSFKEFSSLIK